ncbi:hypothetical protein [Azotobacter salinestris]|uniref:hypothetical protein n=1 Tax=Azotobacter salinestris TaxID=69964 RepID=UPI0032DF7E75
MKKKCSLSRIPFDEVDRRSRQAMWQELMGNKRVFGFDNERLDEINDEESQIHTGPLISPASNLTPA